MKCNPTGDRIPGLTPAIEAGVFVSARTTDTTRKIAIPLDSKSTHDFDYVCDWYGEAT